MQTQSFCKFSSRRFARAAMALAMGGLFAASLSAQSVPGPINYQGRLTDNSPQQNPLNGTFPMRFDIFDAVTGGTSQWNETDTVTVNGGVFNVQLGAGTAFPATLFSSSAVRYVEITVNPGGSQEILTPRQQITQTGYANVAATAANATTAATAGNATQLGGAAASAYQKTLGSPACPANQFLATLNPDGSTTCAASTGFSGSLAGNVTGIQSATVVATVGGQTAANVAAGAVLANAATNLNTASVIVKRDASGNFTAGTITGALSGNATTATSATSFSGSLAGEVTGNQGTTVVTNAVAANTANAIVRRNPTGGFTAGVITGSLTGNASTASALAANGTNCAAGQFPLGVDAAGNAESCSTEVDPKVGANTTSYVPRWNGTALVASRIYDNGTNVGVGVTAAPTAFFQVGDAAPGGVPVLDANQGSLNSGTYGVDQWQSFVAVNTGVLTSVAVMSNGCPATTGTLSIYSGAGTGGTLLQQQPITINGPCNAFNSFTLTTSPSVTAAATYTFRIQSAADFNSTVHTGGLYAGGFYFSNVYGSPANWDWTFQVYVASAAQPAPMVVTSTGNVGVGISAPARSLHLKDVLRLQPMAGPPASPVAGDIYYDGALNRLRYFNGTAWVNL